MKQTEQTISLLPRRRAVPQLLLAVLFAAALGGCAGISDGPRVLDREADAAAPGTELPQHAIAPEVPAPAPAAVEISAPAENNIYFLFDSAELDATARALLSRYANYLQRSESPLLLEGHTDERGTREYNLALGQSRAEAVLDYLILQGVLRSRLRGVSFGEERPADAGHSEDAWQKNRRVELLLN